MVAGRVAEALDKDARDLVRDLDERMHKLGEGERFEEAATVRDRMVALIRATDRNQRMTPLAVSPELVAARPGAVGGWEFVCVRYGKLAGTTLSPPGADPRPYIDALVDTAEVVSPHLGRAPACHPEEVDKILRWLESPDVRLVRIDGEWSCPVNGAGQMRERLQLLRDRPDTGFSDS